MVINIHHELLHSFGGGIVSRPLMPFEPHASLPPHYPVYPVRHPANPGKKKKTRHSFAGMSGIIIEAEYFVATAL